MRTLGNIPHPAYLVTVFSWSEKYIVKIEARGLEQAYKFPQDAYPDWRSLARLFDDEMMEQVRQTFHQMATSMKASVDRHDS